MNKRGAILLTELLSLVMGVIIVITIGVAASGFFGTPKNTDKSSELAEFVNLIQDARDDNPLEYSIRLDDEDLFLFFSKGNEPIMLEYIGDKDHGHFIFDRPEACEGVACVCYCKDGPYIRETETEHIFAPRLIQASLLERTNFSCSENMCTPISGDYIFTNSRGTQQFRDQLEAEKNNIPNPNQGTRFYVPSTLDIVLLVHTIDRQHDIFGGPTYTVLLDNMRDYAWRNGYVLGGYGLKQTAADEVIGVPPVTLRFEQPEPGIIGICIHGTCLFEEDLEAYKELLSQVRQQNLLQTRFTIFTGNLDDVLSCITEVQVQQDVSYLEECSEQIETMQFSLSQVLDQEFNDFRPRISFTANEEEPRISTISLSIQETTIDYIERPLVFSCLGLNAITRPFSIIALSPLEDGDYVYQAGNGAFCNLEIATSE